MVPEFWVCKIVGKGSVRKGSDEDEDAYAFTKEMVCENKAEALAYIEEQLKINRHATFTILEVY